jgi:hypothetical protein
VCPKVPEGQRARRRAPRRAIEVRVPVEHREPAVLGSGSGDQCVCRWHAVVAVAACRKLPQSARRRIGHRAIAAENPQRVELELDIFAHAVELAREGVSLNVLQRQLGHASLGTTSIYLQGIDIEEIISAVHARPSTHDVRDSRPTALRTRRADVAGRNIAAPQRRACKPDRLRYLAVERTCR